MHEVKFYGAMWCKDCIRSKRFLDTHKIDFEFFDMVEDPELAKKIIELNIKGGYGAKRKIPTIVIDDKIILSEPTDEELSKALGL